MNESFEREFYRSRWQRVLPVGPYGVQPYVHARARLGLGRRRFGPASPRGDRRALDAERARSLAPGANDVAVRA